MDAPPPEPNFFVVFAFAAGPVLRTLRHGPISHVDAMLLAGSMPLAIDAKIVPRSVCPAIEHVEESTEADNLLLIIRALCATPPRCRPLNVMRLQPAYYNRESLN